MLINILSQLCNFFLFIYPTYNFDLREALTLNINGHIECGIGLWVHSSTFPSFVLLENFRFANCGGRYSQMFSYEMLRNQFC